MENQNFLKREEFDLETQIKLRLWINTPDYQKGKYINNDMIVSNEEKVLMQERWMRSSKTVKILLNKWTGSDIDWN